MSDAGAITRPNWKSPEMAARRRKRYAADRRLRWMGLGAITFAIGFLVILVASLLNTGASAFVQTKVSVPIDLSTAEINPDDIMGGSWRSIVRGSLLQLEPDIPRSDRRA